jgi:hypothetical protein
MVSGSSQSVRAAEGWDDLDLAGDHQRAGADLHARHVIADLTMPIALAGHVKERRTAVRREAFAEKSQ